MSTRTATSKHDAIPSLTPQTEFAEIASHWQTTVTETTPTFAAPSPTAEPRVLELVVVVVPPLLPEHDLANNAAGAAAKAKRDEVNRQAPVLNLVARFLGVKTDERAWRVGGQGEAKVGKELARLPVGWHVFHAVRVGEHGSDIDHVVIGPAGVFTLNAKCHPRGKATVYEHKLYVNGCATDYLRNSRFESRRASKMLTAACGVPVAVAAAIVFVDLDDFTVKTMPTDVHVTTRLQLHKWLTSLPTTLDAAQVHLIHENARRPSTWTTP